MLFVFFINFCRILAAMERYIEKARELIDNLYTQGTPDEYDTALSTGKILSDLRCLLPANSIDEFDVYDIMSELFVPYYTEEVENVEEKNPETDEKTTIKKIINGAKFLWYLKKK